MKIKAKQIFIVGAFIVLTLVGYISLDKDEILFDSNFVEDEKTDSGNNINTNNDKNITKTIYLHIEGAIKHSGIKEVPIGTRLFEVIELSGGVLEEADVSKINLASIVKDEQKIYIPYKVKNELNVSKESYVIMQNEHTYNELININTASKEELQKLEGVGTSTAEKILNYRNEKGYFSSIEEIKNISGIGEAKFNKIKNNITI